MTLLEDLPWSDCLRWVRRTRNVGKASTEGIEPEAKFRLDHVLDDSPLGLLAERTHVVSGGPSHIGWQLRLELKLSRRAAAGSNRPAPATPAPSAPARPVPAPHWAAWRWR